MRLRKDEGTLVASDPLRDALDQKSNINIYAYIIIFMVNFFMNSFAPTNFII